MSEHVSCVKLTSTVLQRPSTMAPQMPAVVVDAEATIQWAKEQVQKKNERSMEPAKSTKSAKRQRQKERKAAEAAATAKGKSDPGLTQADGTGGVAVAAKGKSDPGLTQADGTGAVASYAAAVKVKSDPGLPEADGSGAVASYLGHTASSSSPMPPPPPATPPLFAPKPPGPPATPPPAAGETGDGKKNQLDCNFAADCGNYNLKRDEFLLEDPDASWQGKIWGVCFDCSDMVDPREFKRMAKKEWEARSRLVRGRNQRARSITFNNVLDKIKEALPQASSSVRWELATQRTKAIAASFIAAFEQQNLEAQKICHEINQKYLQNLEIAANDPTNACPVDAQTLTAEEASYLTHIQEGIAFMFICRMAGCMFFGLNSQWVERSDGKYQFRCPCCGDLYKPNSTVKNQIQASFMLQVVDPVTNQAARIPTTWPPSEEMNWVNNQIELKARDIQTPTDVLAWHQKSQLDLKRLIEKESVPVGLKEMTPSSDIDHRFQGNWKWAEFKTRTFWGAKFTDETAARDPFSNWTELIGLIANTVASNRDLISRM